MCKPHSCFFPHATQLLSRRILLPTSLKCLQDLVLCFLFLSLCHWQRLGLQGWCWNHLCMWSIWPGAWHGVHFKPCWTTVRGVVSLWSSLLSSPFSFYLIWKCPQMLNLNFLPLSLLSLKSLSLLPSGWKCTIVPWVCSPMHPSQPEAPHPSPPLLHCVTEHAWSSWLFSWSELSFKSSQFVMSFSSLQVQPSVTSPVKLPCLSQEVSLLCSPEVCTYSPLL